MATWKVSVSLRLEDESLATAPKPKLSRMSEKLFDAATEAEAITAATAEIKAGLWRPGYRLATPGETRDGRAITATRYVRAR